MTFAPTITVASYNMRKAIGTDRRRDPGRVLAVLKEIDADVVALQEADKRFGGRGSAVPHELIDSHGLYKPVPVQVRHKRVMDRMPGGKQVDKFLKIDTRNIGWHGNALLVKPHVGILDAVAGRKQKMPTVLMGDTNEWRKAAGCLSDLNGSFRIAPTGPSFHSRHPLASLDRIIVGNELRIEAAGVHMSPSARKASDHLPIWARLAV